MKINIALPNRAYKPRTRGLTITLDNGVPTQFFKDIIQSYGDLIDLVKFGWGSSLVMKNLEEKIIILNEAKIDYFFGGSLFEKFYLQKSVNKYYEYCLNYKCKYVEISNGTIEMDNTEKGRFIKEFSKEFSVLSEVGYKDADRSLLLSPAKWIEYIKEDLENGAIKVITESRESGTSGICRKDGELRYGLIEEIVESSIDTEKLIFEAPNKTLQVYFVKRLGSDVNLANISLSDVVSQESIRLGLRAETLDFYERGNISA